MAKSRGDPRVLVSQSAFEAAVSHARASAPMETGGLLIGVSTADGLWITDAIEIAVATRYRNRFTIPAGVTHTAIDALRDADPRLGYIGDWHSHPLDAPASNRDLTTLAEIALSARGRKRIVAVVRCRASRWNLDLWWTPRLRIPRRLDFEFAGPLLPTADAQTVLSHG